MRHAQSEKAYLSLCSPGGSKSRYLFFPGCQLGASEPVYVEKAYAFLRENLPDTGLLLSCCGIPAGWAGETAALNESIGNTRAVWEGMGRPEIIFACPSCEKVFKKHLPEIGLISLYEMICRYGLPERGAAKGTVSVFDPCSSRYDPGMQKCVRDIILAAGYSIEDLAATRNEAVCCGFGGHIYPANMELMEKIVKTRASLGRLPFVTYCSNCRDILSEGGKECFHILDLLCIPGGGARPAPSLSTRRKNREALKNNLLRQVWGQSIMEEEKMEIVLTPELETKLNGLLILNDDLRETVDYCEKSDAKLLNTETGCFVGHRRLGAVTYWVEYRLENGRCLIHNAYSHRMSIEGEEG